ILAPPPSASPAQIVSAVPMGPSPTSVSSVRVTFDRAMNFATFTAADCSLTGPGEQTLAVSNVKEVSGSAGKGFTVILGLLTATGTYTLKIGPDVQDLSGVSMATFQGTFQISAPQTYVSALSVAIPAGGSVAPMLTVSDAFVIGDVDVKVSLRHPVLSELRLHLQAPDGTDVLLFNHAGGSTANLSGTTFDDEASASLAQGQGPYVGSFRPAAPLSILDGKSVAGTWKLWVEDDGTNSGTLDSWSLVVSPRAG